MIELKRTWWHPTELAVDLPSEFYTHGVARYLTITRKRHVITGNAALRYVPLVVSFGTYTPEKTRCPINTNPVSYQKRFEDDARVPLYRPRAYKAFRKLTCKRRQARVQAMLRVRL